MSKVDRLKSSLSLPLIMAPMFLVSNPEMALAACAEGIVGSFPALNQRTSEGFEEWLTIMSARKTTTPYAVNLIVHKTNPRLQDDLALCMKYKVPIVITSLGAVKDVIDAVHSYGGIVLHDVTNAYHAKKAADAGADGIIAVCAGAGGHAGTINPFALVNEIRSFFDGILVLAGSLSHGKDILAAQIMGADFAYMGTRFIATKESGAVDAYKHMLCEASAADIIYTPKISGIPASFLRQSLEAAGIDWNATDDHSGLKSFSDEAKAWKNIWSAGQGVGSIQDIPSIQELIRRLKTEYEQAKNKI